MQAAIQPANAGDDEELQKADFTKDNVATQAPQVIQGGLAETVVNGVSRCMLKYEISPEILNCGFYTCRNDEEDYDSTVEPPWSQGGITKPYSISCN